MTQSCEKCQYCNNKGYIYLNKPKICVNCKGKRCYLCDKTGPYTFIEECNKCYTKKVN